MRTDSLKRVIGVIGVALSIGCSTPSPPGDVADTVYTNGKIYTVNEAQPWAEAVAIKDGKFLVVGSNAEVEDVTGEGTEVIDLDGGFAMPGIGDVHIHPALVMPKRAFCGLPGTFYEPSEQQTVDALKECIANYPEDREWFIAAGFSPSAMSPETLTREFLDHLIPDRPAYVEDETGGHSAWFNTKAMEVAGLSKDFEDSSEGYYSRTEDGDLAGMAYEGAVNPLLDALPPFDVELKKLAFTKLMEEALSKGVTAFGEAYVGVFDGDLQAWEELHQEDKIRQHVVLYLKGNLGTAELTPVETLEEWWNSYDLPGSKGVKLGMGGSLESITEALVDGYGQTESEPTDGPIPIDEFIEDQPADANVEPLVPADQFSDYVAALDAAGFQVMVHAIGDGSVRATLDGYEKVIRTNGNNRLRHRIDHCSLVHPDDFQRFVELDVSCTIWPPLNAPLDYNILGIKPVLKPETWARMYANREMWDAGIRLANHTDAPAATMWPWFGMEAAATRGFPGKPEKGKMGEEHALTVEELIEAYTINSAWALRYDDVTGTIEEGKFADMIVLNHNLFEIPETEIHKTEVQKTIFKGEVVYQSR
ncbi:MAG: amidohydrolase [Thermoanaerobaculia bacterium]